MESKTTLKNGWGDFICSVVLACGCFRCLSGFPVTKRVQRCLGKLCISESKCHCPLRLVHSSQDKQHPECSQINSTDILLGSLWQPKQIFVPKRAFRNTWRHAYKSWRLKFSNGVEHNLQKWFRGVHVFCCFGLWMLSLPQRLSCYKVTSKVLW